ncbi:MAG: glycosyl hydrolase, partial [Bacteroidota bacterium]
GFLERKNHENDQERAISIWPDNPMGHGAEAMKYRFQWNFPIFFSPHNPKKLYAASNHLHVSYDEGQSWEVISPDLTRNDPSKLGSSGGPITQDNTSVEYYCTIFAAVESPRVKDLLWVGSDDGLVHLSKDGGANWENITPKGLPKWVMINSIEASPYEDGGAYLAATLYKSGDFKPYLYKTSDYGKTWTKITKGIDEEHFTRVIRADPKRPGLLYAGTETGMYISFDDGSNWQSFQLNLPIVPITDLVVKNDNLIASTQGRSIWMIDDLTPLHQLTPQIAQKELHLFQPMPTYRMRGSQAKKPRNAGMNHPNGVMVHYYLQDLTDSTEVKLSFMEPDGTPIQTFSTKAKEKKFKLKVKKGANLFVWNMRYPEAKKFKGMILWWASLNGPKAIPGAYQVKLEVGGKEELVDFKILKDPRTEASDEDFKKQFDFMIAIRDKVSDAHQGIKDIRDIRQQLKHYTDRLGKHEANQAIVDLGKAIDSSLTKVEEALYQTKNRSRQDPLNFPIRLTNKLAHLNALTSIGDYAPTNQAVAVQKELSALIDTELSKLKQIKEVDLPQFNQLMRDQSVDAVILQSEEE